MAKVERFQIPLELPISLGLFLTYYKFAFAMRFQRSSRPVRAFMYLYMAARIAFFVIHPFSSALFSVFPPA